MSKDNILEQLENMTKEIVGHQLHDEPMTVYEKMLISARLKARLFECYQLQEISQALRDLVELNKRRCSLFEEINPNKQIGPLERQRRLAEGYHG